MTAVPLTKQKKTPPPISKTAKPFSDHIRIEERSMALHREVAQHIRRNPKLMDKAVKNIQRYLKKLYSEDRTPVRALLEWQELLENQSLEEILGLMVDIQLLCAWSGKGYGYFTERLGTTTGSHSKR